VAGLLIVPLYIASLSASYFFRFSIEPWSKSSLVDNVEGVMPDVGFGAFAVVGALLVARRPANAIGRIMASTGLMEAIFTTGTAYATYVMATRDRPDALAVFGAWCANWFWFVMLALALVYLPILFPDGRLLSRRWLPVAVTGGTGALGVAILGTLADTLVAGDHPSYMIDNPIGIEGLGQPTDLPVFVVLEVLSPSGSAGQRPWWSACAAPAASSADNWRGSPTPRCCSSAAA
jgi:hypothetical protein